MRSFVLPGDRRDLLTGYRPPSLGTDDNDLPLDLEVAELRVELEYVFNTLVSRCSYCVRHLMRAAENAFLAFHLCSLRAPTMRTSSLSEADAQRRAASLSRWPRGRRVCQPGDPPSLQSARGLRCSSALSGVIVSLLYLWLARRNCCEVGRAQAPPPRVFAAICSNLQAPLFGSEEEFGEEGQGIRRGRQESPGQGADASSDSPRRPSRPPDVHLASSDRLLTSGAKEVALGLALPLS